MILAITLYGDPVLKKRAEDISSEYPNLNDLVKNMWQTMYAASGVGLAAPQVGLSIRLFVVDTQQLAEKRKKGFTGIKKVFINPTILTETGEEWKYEEGCLSIPGIREDVFRQPSVKIHYFDEQFNAFTEEYDDITARVIQHEYDHIEGILFTDKLKPLKRKLLLPKLAKIARGEVDIDYRVKVYKK
ncbi:MAG: peptide deformylase [Sphingobacteriales bacterium]|nr:peptide deformylase [Sphingobacteriales bacterium]